MESEIVEIREIAYQRLERFARNSDVPSESFVFKDDHLIGIRYRIGIFHAQWLHGDDTIEFFRAGKLIDQIRLGSSLRRAA